MALEVARKKILILEVEEAVMSTCHPVALILLGAEATLINIYLLMPVQKVHIIISVTACL